MLCEGVPAGNLLPSQLVPCVSTGSTLVRFNGVFNGVLSSTGSTLVVFNGVNCLQRGQRLKLECSLPLFAVKFVSRISSFKV